METIKLTKKLLYAFTLLLVLLTGCKKDDEETPRPDPGQDPGTPPTENTLTARAGKDTTIQAGSLLELDGTASKDSKNETFSYQWVILTKPAGSTVNLYDANTASPSLTPDQVGEYEIELTISNDKHSSKDRVKVTAIAATPLEITDDIDVETVLEDRITDPNFADYIVTTDIGVSAELTIKPGVVIEFERGVRFSLENDGLIVAKGTADSKIKFVGVEKTSGFWRGIIIYSKSNANVFEHVEIKHAGSNTMLSNIKAALTLFGYESTISLNNSSVSENEGYGMFVSDGGVLRSFAKNTFSQNTEAGILLNANNVVNLDYESSFTGNNGRDVVEIFGTYIEDANKDEVVWTGFHDKTPYLITSDITVTTGWKINPAVSILMARSKSIAINASGYILAEGTATEKITITGAQSTAGFWRGIIIYSTSAMNRIKNAEISYSGSASLVSGIKTNIAIYGKDAILDIQDSEIKGCTGYGIYVSYGSLINGEAETSNTFSDNALGTILTD